LILYPKFFSFFYSSFLIFLAELEFFTMGHESKAVSIEHDITVLMVCTVDPTIWTTIRVC